jgi:transcriptional regulator with XRE-family HTH domain
MKKVTDKHVRARRADGRDMEVGLRVRSRRLERIGVAFQQVQKCEKGGNRIGAGRLQRIAEALEVPITFSSTTLQVLRYERRPSLKPQVRSGS